MPVESNCDARVALRVEMLVWDKRLPGAGLASSARAMPPFSSKYSTETLYGMYDVDVVLSILFNPRPRSTFPNRADRLFSTVDTVDTVQYVQYILSTVPDFLRVHDDGARSPHHCLPTTRCVCAVLYVCTVLYCAVQLTVQRAQGQ